MNNRFSARRFAWYCVGALIAAGCGGQDIVAFHSDDTGGNASTGAQSNTTGQQSSSATGGAGSAGNAYKRSGYGGLTNVWKGVVGSGGLSNERGTEYNECISDYFASRAIKDRTDQSGCTAGTLCSPFCESDSDCPGGGTATPRCLPCAVNDPFPAACDFSRLQTANPRVGNSCVLECSEGPFSTGGTTYDSLECPTGMQCMKDADGRRICMFPDVLWAPFCPEYCAREEDECGEGVPCCDGKVCSPSKTCEAVSCLEFAWKCGDGLPECCDGLTCEGGYCQTP